MEVAPLRRSENSISRPLREEAQQLYRLWEEFEGSMAEFVEAYL